MGGSSAGAVRATKALLSAAAVAAVSYERISQQPLPDPVPPGDSAAMAHDSNDVHGRCSMPGGARLQAERPASALLVAMAWDKDGEHVQAASSTRNQPCSLWKTHLLAPSPGRVKLYA